MIDLVTERLSIVVNYFNPSDDARVLSMTLLSLQSVKSFTKIPYEMIITDGTGKFCRELEVLCAKEGWFYLPSNRKEQYAVSFNRGIRRSSGSHIALLANDIFVSLGWENVLLSEMKRTRAWMIAPYLSFSDFSSQIWSYPIFKRTFNPTVITFNLNIITRNCISCIGELDERFSGCFNDIDYLIRIRQAGGEVVIADAGQISHLGKGTTSASTLVSYSKDCSKFLGKYPELSREGIDVDYGNPVFARSRVIRMLLRLGRNKSLGKYGRVFNVLASRLEPLLQQC